MNKSKSDIRKAMKILLASMEERKHAALSLAAAEKLFVQPEWLAAGTVAVTVSLYPELDTAPVIRRAWQEGKRVAVPKCIPGERQMDFRYLTSFDELETVYAGLREPDPDRTVSASKNEISFLVVPGLAFTETGGRLGFGGGYFDRYLPDYAGSMAALAFEEQILDMVPAEPHDVRIPKIITPDRVFHTY